MEKLDPVSIGMDPKLADKVDEKRTKIELSHYPKKSIININRLYFPSKIPNVTSISSLWTVISTTSGTLIVMIKC